MSWEIPELPMAAPLLSSKPGHGVAILVQEWERAPGSIRSLDHWYHPGMLVGGWDNLGGSWLSRVLFLVSPLAPNNLHKAGGRSRLVSKPCIGLHRDGGTSVRAITLPRPGPPAHQPPACTWGQGAVLTLALLPADPAPGEVSCRPAAPRREQLQRLLPDAGGAGCSTQVGARLPWHRVAQLMGTPVAKRVPCGLYPSLLQQLGF